MNAQEIWGEYKGNRIETILKASGWRRSSQYEEIDEKLDLINRVLDGYGVEAITGDSWHPYYCDIVALYVNMGDPYDMTVLYDVNASDFFVGSWGNFVEALEQEED